MKVLLAPAAAEITVKKSRFIAEAFPVKTQSEMRAMLKAQKQKYADSSHVVHAFVLGQGAQICGMSDDGEPSGTAGRPVLNVLKGFGCNDILLTVTRYFGGTLLGTGGLVKAYTQAAQAVLEDAQTEEFVQRSAFELNLSYQNYEACRFLFEKFCITGLRETFAETVVLSGFVQTSLKNDFEKKIKDVCAGSLL